MSDGPMNHYHVQLIPRYSFEERGSKNFVKPRKEYVFDEQKLNKFSYLVLRNSDAHQITDISEPINSIELEELSIDCLFEALRKR